MSMVGIHPYQMSVLYRRLKFRYGYFSSLDQYKSHVIPGQSLWNLEVTVVSTTATVIYTSFQVLCQSAALLLS